MYLLGIDVGTSGTKTVLYNEKGTVIASYTKEYPMYQPYNGWVEQDPEDWWNAAAEGIKYVLQNVTVSDMHDVAIGLSGQMHGLVMLDSDGNVLRRSIIWCDQRTEKQCEIIRQLVGQERLIQISANPAMTGFTAAKILWVQENEPELYAKCAHILLPKDYIRFRLTGEFATDVSDASGMQLMDVAHRCWSTELLEIFNIDKQCLGKLYESVEVTGKVHQQASKETGLPAGCLIVGGAGDNPAAAVGTGIVEQGSAFNTIGSSAVIYAVTDELCLDKKGRIHSLCASVPGKWTLMSCTQSAGLSLKWFRDTCCQGIVKKAAEQNINPYVLMDELARSAPLGADHLWFLPYLMGERSPHPDSFCRGAFIGLSAKHQLSHMIRSVMEGVSFSQRECLDVFSEMGVSISQMVLCGGGSSSKVWQQMLTDVYERPTTTLTVDQGAAFGAALLAGVGTGVYSSLSEACKETVHYTKPINPSQESGRYQPYIEVYKELYQNLELIYKRMQSI